ncbi:hypothetical protein [Pseudaquabacterium pictum]|uniref:hypothetical protein n=1 Tax=Pseudaquabacterium pictum TaxID=2315236 RepID=UPI001D13FD6C|nr:hypothetical protein [Rubrivivax pictus]
MKRTQVLQQLPHRFGQEFEPVANLQGRTHQLGRGLCWLALGIRPAIQLQNKLGIADGAARLNAWARSGVGWHQQGQALACQSWITQNRMHIGPWQVERVISPLAEALGVELGQPGAQIGRHPEGMRHRQPIRCGWRR